MSLCGAWNTIICEIPKLLWIPLRVKQCGRLSSSETPMASPGHAVYNKNTDILLEPIASFTIYKNVTEAAHSLYISNRLHGTTPLKTIIFKTRFYWTVLKYRVLQPHKSKTPVNQWQRITVKRPCSYNWYIWQTLFTSGCLLHHANSMLLQILATFLFPANCQ